MLGGLVAILLPSGTDSTIFVRVGAVMVVTIPLWAFTFLKPLVSKEAETKIIDLTKSFPQREFHAEGGHMTEAKDGNAGSSKQLRSRPERMLRWMGGVGILMFGFSTILIFLGVSGAALHNFLQLGGLLLAIVGGLGAWIASKRR